MSDESMKLSFSQKMSRLGFMVLEDDGEKMYLLETSYYFLSVASFIDFETGRKIYDFDKWYYNKNKGTTQLVKNYSKGLAPNAMIKRVGKYMKYMLEKGYLKTENKDILLFAIQMSKHKLFI